MRRSGQVLFLPHAKFKQREKESSRPFFVQHGSELCVGKSSLVYIYGYPYNSENDWQSPDKAKKVLTRLKKDNPKLDSEKVKNVGAVVTGTSDELKKYQNREFIRAFSLWATIDKY